MTRASANYTTSSSNSVTGYKQQSGVISAQLNTVLARTSDTGQVTFSTVTTLSATRDYEIYSFTDASQGAFPLYLRVDYDGATQGYPIYISVGTGTNGAGVLTGVLLTKAQGQIIQSYTPTGGLTRTCYAASDGSYLMLAVNLQNNAATVPDALGCIVIERTRESDGSTNGNGFTVWRWTANADNGAAAPSNTFAGCYSRTYDTTGTVVQPTVSYDLQAVLPNPANNASYAASNASYAFPCLTAAGYQLQGASKALMVAVPGDFARLAQVTIGHYGANMTFLPLSGSQQLWQAYMGSQTAAATKVVSPLVRFE